MTTLLQPDPILSVGYRDERSKRPVQKKDLAGQSYDTTHNPNCTLAWHGDCCAPLPIAAV